MAVPQTLSDFTQMLRADVERAGVGNSRGLGRNAVVLIENMRAYLKPTPLIDEACATALARCQEYANEISDRGLLYSLSDAAIQQARNLALNAIKELESRLEEAKPSDRAIILAVGW